MSIVVVGVCAHVCICEHVCVRHTQAAVFPCLSPVFSRSRQPPGPHTSLVTPREQERALL